MFLTEESRIMEFFSWKRLIIQCYNLFCKGSACFDVVDIEWVQIVLQNCEKLQNDRAKKEEILSEVCMIKKGLIVLFTGDVVRKSMFKRLFNHRRIRRALKGPTTRGVWGHAPPAEILKSWCSETPFLVFWEDKFCPKCSLNQLSFLCLFLLAWPRVEVVNIFYTSCAVFEIALEITFS